jgi:hypothetical protein
MASDEHFLVQGMFRNEPWAQLLHPKSFKIHRLRPFRFLPSLPSFIRGEVWADLAFLIERMHGTK